MKSIVLLLFLCIYLLFSCNTGSDQAAKTTQQNISASFKITIIVHYYPSTILTSISLTNDQLKVMTVTEKDSLSFSNGLQPSVELDRIANINFTSLKQYYSNPCIDDGLGLEVFFEKGDLKRQVTLDNYYQNEVGQIMEFVNAQVPSEFKTWYDKETLTKDYMICNSKEEK